MTHPLVLKFGGELLETPESRGRVAALAATLVPARPLVIVHGGGRAIDVELARRQVVPQKVDGLRVTDAATLASVVAVLAGSANTDLVAALTAAGVRAVGLTGVDAGFGRARRISDYHSTSGAVVDLGLVGDPIEIDGALIELLLRHRYVPVIASLGFDETATAADAADAVLNVNADVMACRVAAALAGSDLVIAGGTAGVLDAAGHPIAVLDADGIDRMIASGAATAGMIAKLAACRAALESGVASVRIIDGRALEATLPLDAAPGTTVTLAASHAQLGPAVGRPSR
jgi:acetylglutamate kinase